MSKAKNLGGMPDKFYCEGCEQDIPADEFGVHELCRECMQAAKEQADYRAWVNRGG